MPDHFPGYRELQTGDQVILLRAGQVVVGKQRHIWSVDTVAPQLRSARSLLLVTPGRNKLLVADLPADQPLPATAGTTSLRSLLFRSERALATAGKARQLLDWYQAHRFCGFCGAPTMPASERLAVYCQPCGQHFFPRINPCVIVLVSRGERLLLARNAHHRSGFSSCLAGFIEAGESAEDTVLREVKEESGLDVHNVCYFKSQSWPFPSQLMLGFHADYQAGEIVPEPNEIACANWYRWDQLPGTLPPAISLAGQLITDFVQRMQSMAA